MPTKHMPLRPATSIDAELAKPHPEDLTDIEKEKELSESGRADEKAQNEGDHEELEAERNRSDRRPI